MAVFSTNLIIYKHTDFEQTFVLEDGQSNSAKDLTGFTGSCKMQRTLNLGGLTAFNLAFTNRTLGKVRISLTSAQTANIADCKYFYELMLTDPNGVVDLTGFTGQSQLRKSPSNPRFADIQVGIKSAADGVINISIASTITKFLQGGRHVYDVILTRPSGFKLVAFEGNANVRSGINTMVHYFGSP